MHILNVDMFSTMLQISQAPSLRAEIIRKHINSSSNIFPSVIPWIILVSAWDSGRTMLNWQKRKIYGAKVLLNGDWKGSQ